MISLGKPLQAGLLAAALSLASLSAHGTNDKEPTTASDARAEISETMQSIGEYSEEEREEALARAREALDRLDAEIEEEEEELRDNWADMSESAQEASRERLRDLRDARNELGEQFGALQASSASTWDELKGAFSEAWGDVTHTWDALVDDLSSE